MHPPLDEAAKMPVAWKAEIRAPGTYRLWLGNAIAGHVVAQGSGWRVNPAIAGRRGSRKAWKTPQDAAGSYFGRKAADAIAEVEQAALHQLWADRVNEHLGFTGEKG
jgi:hypothetical protein